MPQVQFRGFIYQRPGEKKKWQGNYARYYGKRKFNLIPLDGKGATKRFSSPKAAMKQGYRVIAR